MKEGKDDYRTFKEYCKEAKKRMKSGYWKDFDDGLKKRMEDAENSGENPARVADYYVNTAIDGIKNTGNGDDFYKKVKEMLDTYGEVSDAIGRLIDHEVYDALPYDRKQKYTLELSNKYLEALERYRKERAFGGLKQSE
ncbi:MAG: hypothetical protein MRZ91_05325 [Christensenellaceae bacterium]|nr:hypothetical protein [Christensenellaceae bacterium]MDD6927323.1 hypothetical protein [bacterium]MDY2850691.1 hypothetical protein [Christensenellaceae bacterium]